MDALRLKPRQPVEYDDVENWDDDDFMIDGEDITVRSTSTSANAAPHRRDSHSSFRSDFESVHAEEEKHVHLPGDDEKSTADAIAVATNAGIPIPKNVPPSALMGGTIKRLGGRKSRRSSRRTGATTSSCPMAARRSTSSPRTALASRPS